MQKPWNGLLFCQKEQLLTSTTIVRRPSIVRGIDQTALVDELLCCPKPWILVNEFFLRLNSVEDEIAALRCKAERRLTSLLDHLGFYFF